MTKLFQPTQNHIKSSNLFVYEDYLNKNYKKKFKNYFQLWNWSVKNPSDFWKSITEFYQVPLTKNKNSKLIQKNAQFWKNNFFFNFQTNYFQLIEKNKSNSLAIHFIGENNYEEKISYKELLKNFWLNIDPFDAYGQFCDKGYSYRSVAFYENDYQKDLIEKDIKRLEKKFKKKVVTYVKEFEIFYKAEDKHQDYYQVYLENYLKYKKACKRERILDIIWGS